LWLMRPCAFENYSSRVFAQGEGRFDPWVCSGSLRKHSQIRARHFRFQKLLFKQGPKPGHQTHQPLTAIGRQGNPNLITEDVPRSTQKLAGQKNPVGTNRRIGHRVPTIVQRRIVHGGGHRQQEIRLCRRWRYACYARGHTGA
jgi:hypothetical protein